MYNSFILCNIPLLQHNASILCIHIHLRLLATFNYQSMCPTFNSKVKQITLAKLNLSSDEVQSAYILTDANDNSKIMFNFMCEYIFICASH